MKASTYRAFRRLNRRIDRLHEQVERLALLSDQDREAERVALGLDKDAAALTGAVAGSTTKEQTP